MSLSPEIITMLLKIYVVTNIFLFEDMNGNMSENYLASEEFIHLDENCKFSRT